MKPTRTAQSAPRGGIPEFIGRYRVLERIGKGAMGVVYAANDEAIGRRVAIKVMMADLQEDSDIRERFYREAKVTGQLAHGNIVTLFDLGEDRGHPFLVMELLEGLPLGEYLKTPAAASLDAKISLMTQVCEGLQVAHSRGVIHRDIKPSNLFVQSTGTLKILDFGVARLSSSNLTLSGLLMGTPEYMSPEQTQGRPVDARSDLFSAGAVFYFILTGRSPFGSPDLPAMLRKVMYEEPAPLTDADAPESLRRILAKALAKSPSDRYQQCAELAADLAQVRRVHDGASRRIAQAACQRYQQILTVIAQRRTLGRSLGVPDIDKSCDEAVSRLAARFSAFAAPLGSAGHAEPIDRSVATASLEALQVRHNGELASLAALRTEAADKLRAQAADTRRDLSPERASGGGAPSWRTRAAALWRRR